MQEIKRKSSAKTRKRTGKESLDRALSGHAGHPVVGNVLALTHVLSNQIGRAFDSQIEGRFGLSLSEWRVMLTLALDPGASSIDIINSWAMDKMAISRAVSKLERNGLVRRQRNKHDRRSYSLSLTARGKRTYDRVLPYANERYHDLLSCLTGRELNGLRRALDKLNSRAVELSH